MAVETEAESIDLLSRPAGSSSAFRKSQSHVSRRAGWSGRPASVTLAFAPAATLGRIRQQGGKRPPALPGLVLVGPPGLAAVAATPWPERP